MIRHISLLGALTGMSACGGGMSAPVAPPIVPVTMSSFASVGPDGLIAGNAEPESEIIGFSTAGGNGFAYAVQSFGPNVTARAGLITDGTFGLRPTNGTGTYTAAFTVVEVVDSTVSNTVTRVDGTMPIRVDFNLDRVEGEGDGLRIDGRLAATTIGVDGITRGNSFDGITEWRGTDGQLRGRVVATSIIGAFHGHTATTAYAGGFTGQAR